MKTVIIRDLPDDIHRAAKHAAVDAGLSLNKWLIEIIRKATDQERKDT
jgi:predicted HicB family RNase H-like nuclease